MILFFSLNEGNFFICDPMVTRSFGVNSYFVVFLDLLVQKSKRKIPIFFFFFFF
jgi:hypothetical protein